MTQTATIRLFQIDETTRVASTADCPPETPCGAMMIGVVLQRQAVRHQQRRAAHQVRRRREAHQHEEQKRREGPDEDQQRGDREAPRRPTVRRVRPESQSAPRRRAAWRASQLKPVEAESLRQAGDALDPTSVSRRHAFSGPRRRGRRAEQLEIEPGQDQADDRQHIEDRRALAEAEELEGVGVAHPGKHGGGAPGAAMRHGPEQVERHDRIDAGQDHDQQQHRPQPRQCDAEKAPHGPAPSMRAA